jgi:hypothetical protein
MWIYAAVLTIVGLFALLSLSLPNMAQSVRTVLLAATVIVLALFIGLRDRVGADWSIYEATFGLYHHAEFYDVLTTTPMEPAYAVLNFAVQLLGGDIHFVNFICAVIVLAGLVRFAYLIDVDPVLLLFLAAPYLLFVIAMCFTRQAVAVGLGCAGLGYWVRGDRKKFFLLIILAIGFHYSAIFVLALVWMNSWKRTLIAAPVALVAVVGCYLLGSMMFGRYFALYVENTQDMYASGVWFRLAIVLLGVGVAILQRKRWAQEPGLFRLIAGASVLALCLIPIATVASTLANRVCFYLLFVYLVTLARATRFSRVELRPLVLAGIYVTTYACFLVWFAMSSYAADWWIPYHSALLGTVDAR